MLKQKDIDRFWSKVNKNSGKFWHGTECWEWLGGLDRDGYGRYSIRINNKVLNLRAHRVSYSLKILVPKENEDTHHLCQNKQCVNPNHLQFLIKKLHHKIHIKDSTKHQTSKTHCPQGHEYNLENTYWYKNHRYCKTCTKIANRKMIHYQGNPLNKDKTHCIYGHALVLPNLYINDKGHRQCRQCCFDRIRRYRKENKLKYGITRRPKSK